MKYLYNLCMNEYIYMHVFTDRKECRHLYQTSIYVYSSISLFYIAM